MCPCPYPRACTRAAVAVRSVPFTTTLTRSSIPTLYVVCTVCRCFGARARACCGCSLNIKCVAPFLNHVYHFKFVFSLICLYFPPELDRDMDGFTYRANDKLVDTRPLVNLKIVRSETGHSHLGYSFSGLKVSWFIRSCSRVLRPRPCWVVRVHACMPGSSACKKGNREAIWMEDRLLFGNRTSILVVRSR